MYLQHGFLQASTASSASDAPMSLEEPAGESAQQQHQPSAASMSLDETAAGSSDQPHEATATESERVTDSTNGRPALERLSSGAKRHADRAWSDSRTPLKRQELDQEPSGPASQAAAGDTANSDTAMTHALASDIVSAADDIAGGGTAMTHGSVSDNASAATDRVAEDTADSDAAMTHALATDIVSAADDKADSGAADNDSALPRTAHQKDTPPSNTESMSHADVSVTDSADGVMSGLDDEMEGLTSSAAAGTGDNTPASEDAAVPSLAAAPSPTESVASGSTGRPNVGNGAMSTTPGTQQAHSSAAGLDAPHSSTGMHAHSSSHDGEEGLASYMPGSSHMVQASPSSDVPGSGANRSERANQQEAAAPEGDMYGTAGHESSRTSGDDSRVSQAEEASAVHGNGGHASGHVHGSEPGRTAWAQGGGSAGEGGEGNMAEIRSRSDTGDSLACAQK